jgi:sugar/nucleoside kinase (ribokinase family)
MTGPSAIRTRALGRFGSAAQIAIIGSINRDEVWDEHGNQRRGWGGILYNIAALARFAPARTTILPVARLGSDACGPVGRWLRHLPQVDSSALVLLDQPGNLCQMRYLDPDRRKERLLHRVPSLSYGALRPALKADVALVNFISGNDVAPSALERFRRDFHGIIYMDIHSYLLGRRRDAGRFARRPSGWQRIISCADVLQMNEIEFATLTDRSAEPQTVRAWADDVMTPHRCYCLLVTLGAIGAFCATRQGSKWHLRHSCAGRRPRGFDPTGCGDTFSGLWLSAWLKGRDPVKCTQIAAHGAARPVRPAV